MVAGRVPEQGEIIWIDFDPKSGHEQAGRRPAVVLSQTAYNERTGRAFVCPITSKVKGYPFEIPVRTKSVQGVVLSDHLKNLDWTARNTVTTGEKISRAEIESVWAFTESVMGLF